MCHPSVFEWTDKILTEEMVSGKRVLECGSFDVNGSVKPRVESFDPEYLVGIDIRQGPKVDVIMDVVDLPDSDLEDFDVVVSTEMLEHVEDWRGAIHGMLSVIKPGGDLILTTRAPGFPVHDYPGDHWRYTTDDMFEIFGVEGLEIVENTRDWHPGHPGVFVHVRVNEYKGRPESWDDVNLAKP
jgi:SAM-dependent methyltransferase